MTIERNTLLRLCVQSIRFACAFMLLKLKYLRSVQACVGVVFSIYIYEVSSGFIQNVLIHADTCCLWIHARKKTTKRAHHMSSEHMSRIECILFSVQLFASIQSLVVRSRSVHFFFKFLLFCVSFYRFNFNNTPFFVPQGSEFPFASQRFARESVFWSAPDQSNV